MKRGDSLGMMELSQEIDSHMVVIDEENPTTAIPTKMWGALQSTFGSAPPIAREVPSTTSTMPQGPTTWLNEPFSIFYLFFISFRANQTLMYLAKWCFIHVLNFNTECLGFFS